MSYPACINFTVLIFLIDHQGERKHKELKGFLFVSLSGLVYFFLVNILSELFYAAICLKFCSSGYTPLLGRKLLTYLSFLYAYFTLFSPIEYSFLFDLYIQWEFYSFVLMLLVLCCTYELTSG